MRIGFILIVGYMLAILLNSCQRNCDCMACSCQVCQCHNCNQNQCNCIKDVVDTIPITYNLYIENSGSMQGFFDNGCNLKTILKEYYDRIKEQLDEDDSITLNFINEQIERYNGIIENFLTSAQNKCTAPFTRLADILSMSMDSLQENHVNILVSDFSFSTDIAGLDIKAARSGITKLFSEKLKKNNDISIAILKYNCDFKGKYYPGGIKCNQSLPIYIWVFGQSEHVKKITRLQIKEECNAMMFQPWQDIPVLEYFNINDSRIVDKEDNSIKVKNWKEDRFDKKYKLSFNVDMSSILLGKDDLTNKAQYTISEGYMIDTIDLKEDDIYSFSISTPDHPSPANNIEINFSNNIPDWVDKSNFSGTGIPPVGQTQNVKYLIEGVYDAYYNKSHNYLTININLK